MHRYRIRVLDSGEFESVEFDFHGFCAEMTMHLSKETWLRCNTKKDSKRSKVNFGEFSPWNRLDSSKPSCQALQHS